MPNLLFEIGCEELPASACEEAKVQLPGLCSVLLGVSPSEVFVGPRRLALLVRDLPERTADEWRKGPPKSVAFGPDGGVTAAGEGFARRHNVSVEELSERDGFVGVEAPGRPIADVLPERLAEIVRGLSFGKSMRWQAGGLRFPRPIRWLCAKLGADTIEVELEGIPCGGVSYGLRFDGGPVEIATADAYRDTLVAAGVEPDRERRWEAIRSGLEAIGGWSDPGGVTDEVVHLVESPLVLEARFDERFLQLPVRVVTTAMQSHQRYFPLGGNRFALVANGGDPDVVRAGHEQVLENRLDDASFTFERDVAKGIDRLAEELGRITFVAGAGSYSEKAERVVRIVEALGGGDASLEAARLAKADQAAELVREFPDLEGHIGAEYARLAGYPEAVCAAIDEQYLPDSAGASLPATEGGKLVSAADKIDTLTVVFALGRRPTGSRDPFGLRRSAIGLCRLADEGGLTIPLELLPADVRDFVAERYEALLDVPVEIVRAARAAEVVELGAVAKLSRALASLPDERMDLIHTAYTRAHRIAREAGEGAVEPSLLREPAEQDVARALERVDPAIRAAVAESDFESALAAAAELADPLARFFDEVLVMDEDAAVRANRLRLLLEVRAVLGQLGDFSQIPR